MEAAAYRNVECVVQQLWRNGGAGMEEISCDYLTLSIREIHRLSDAVCLRGEWLCNYDKFDVKRISLRHCGICIEGATLMLQKLPKRRGLEIDLSHNLIASSGAGSSVGQIEFNAFLYAVAQAFLSGAAKSICLSHNALDSTDLRIISDVAKEAASEAVSTSKQYPEHPEMRAEYEPPFDRLVAYDTPPETPLAAKGCERRTTEDILGPKRSPTSFVRSPDEFCLGEEKEAAAPSAEQRSTSPSPAKPGRRRQTIQGNGLGAAECDGSDLENTVTLRIPEQFAGEGDQESAGLSDTHRRRQRGAAGAGGEDHSYHIFAAMSRHADQLSMSLKTEGSSVNEHKITITQVRSPLWDTGSASDATRWEGSTELHGSSAELQPRQAWAGSSKLHASTHQVSARQRATPPSPPPLQGDSGGVSGAGAGAQPQMPGSGPAAAPGGWTPATPPRSGVEWVGGSGDGDGGGGALQFRNSPEGLPMRLGSPPDLTGLPKHHEGYQSMRPVSPVQLALDKLDGTSAFDVARDLFDSVKAPHLQPQPLRRPFTPGASAGGSGEISPAHTDHDASSLGRLNSTLRGRARSSLTQGDGGGAGVGLRDRAQDDLDNDSREKPLLGARVRQGGKVVPARSVLTGSRDSQERSAPVASFASTVLAGVPFEILLENRSKHTPYVCKMSFCGEALPYFYKVVQSSHHRVERRVPPKAKGVTEESKLDTAFVIPQESRLRVPGGHSVYVEFFRASVTDGQWDYDVRVPERGVVLMLEAVEPAPRKAVGGGVLRAYSLPTRSSRGGSRVRERREPKKVVRSKTASGVREKRRGSSSGLTADTLAFHEARAEEESRSNPSPQRNRMTSLARAVRYGPNPQSPWLKAGNRGAARGAEG